MPKKKDILKKVEVIEKPRCPRCNSSQGYLRIKDHVWICRSCGFENKEVIA